jgi:hypothetical protein
MPPSLQDAVLHHVGLARRGWRTAHSPDRWVLTSEILPVFARNCSTLLWIGVRRYTAGYPELLEQSGAICWTLDLDPAVARWGRPERHLTYDLLQLPRAMKGFRFDGVLCNGVLGYGINGADPQAAAIDSLAALVRPGGWVMIGWNTHRCADPLSHPSTRRRFAPASLDGLPPRRIVPGTTHVFDMLRRCAHSPGGGRRASCST